MRNQGAHLVEPLPVDDRGVAPTGQERAVKAEQPRLFGARRDGDSVRVVHTVATPVGPARVTFDAAADPQITLVLGHGAGGGIEARDLEALARVLPGRGITVVRVEQPWRVAGGRVAARPAALDAAWVAVLSDLALRGAVTVGGRSAGARVACRTATQVGAVGCVALAFPLHPPGRPDKSRLPELAETGVPTVVVQGERDPFGVPGDFPPVYDVSAVPGADHAFRVPKGHDQAVALELLAQEVGDWLLQLARAS